MCVCVHASILKLHTHAHTRCKAAVAPRLGVKARGCAGGVRAACGLTAAQRPPRARGPCAPPPRAPRRPPAASRRPWLGPGVGRACALVSALPPRRNTSASLGCVPHQRRPWRWQDAESERRCDARPGARDAVRTQARQPRAAAKTHRVFVGDGPNPGRCSPTRGAKDEPAFCP